MEIITQILPWLYAILAIVVIILVVELIIMVRKSRVVVEDLQKSVDSAVTTINTVSEDLQPAIKKIDPLMDNVGLTVDALNLELLRVDEVMEDVKTMTSAAASATKSIDTVASAPVDFVNSVANKVRSRFGTKGASKESLRITEEKNGDNEKPVYNLVNAIDEAVDSLDEKK